MLLFFSALRGVLQIIMTVLVILACIKYLRSKD